MDQQEFEALMAKVPEGTPDAAQTAPQQAPGGDPVLADPSMRAAIQQTSEAIQKDPLLPAPGNTAPAGTPAVVEAGMAGALKSVFETKDFLFGEPAEGDKSALRQSVEKRDAELDARGPVEGFASGIGQFATGMIGLGKLTDAAKVLPWAKTALEAAPKTVEAGKAAIVGATAFDPHEERLSNLVQDTPLANPVNAWLAADPNDSAAEGRVKAAMESIGLDATLGAVFLGASKVYKALRSGNQAEASKLVDQLVAEKEAAVSAPEPGFGEDIGHGAPAEPPPEVAASASANTIPAGAGGDVPSSVADGLGPDGKAVAVEPAVAQEAPGEARAAELGQEATPKIVANPTDAADAAGTTLNSPKPRVKLSDEDTSGLLAGMQSDADAIEKFGGWYQAIEGGHTFGKGAAVPWAKLNNERDLDDFMARIVDATEEKLDTLKGGAVLSDERLDKVVSRMSSLFNSDPASVLGMVQNAGKQASTMVAHMETGYLVANRMLQDTYALASRIRLGDYLQYGSREAAQEELKRMASLTASVYGASRSITAAGGRAVRRMRLDFKLDPKAIEGLKSMDADQLTSLLVETGGDPKRLAKVVNPSWWGKVGSGIEFLLINNLVSGPKTQVVNMLTNGYMLAARPLERMIGTGLREAVGQGTGATRQVFKESLKQYTYMGTAFLDGFEQVKNAFLRNDSQIAPHVAEAWRGGEKAAQMVGSSWKPWTSFPNILHNGLHVASIPLGLPTRILGTVDEAVKQTVYRSTVMARASVNATREAAEKGLTGKAYQQFVRSSIDTTVDNAFDELGRGTDPEALREAMIATFQQDLTPGSLGRTLQNGVRNHIGLRFVFPFIKTPTNVIRYGWKMTPLLNLAQTEYRQMLRGEMGAAAQAQAMGQMTMGSLFMGAAAYMASQGTITGGGPRGYKEKQELRATGWQEYSAVIQNDDGSKTYVPFGRFDPVAIPMGIITDLMDAYHALGEEETPEFSAAVGSLLIAVSKQFTSKTYLQGVSQFMDAMMDPDAKAEGYAGQTAANLIPFSAALRQLNPDPHLREARDITDKLMATVPGLSESLPPRMDAWGDPILTRKGLWSTSEDQAVDQEMQRLLIEGGAGPVRPNPVHDGIDLREVTMSDGRNAYEVYQQLAGHPPRGPSLKSVIAKRMASHAYQRAPDGETGVRGTKLWLLDPIITKFRSRAMKMLKRDPVVRDAFRKEAMRVRAEWAKSKEPAKKPDPITNIEEGLGLAQ